MLTVGMTIYIDAVVDNYGNLIDIADATIDTSEEDTLFIAMYAKIMALVITIFDNLFKRSVWSELPVVIHPPASDNEIVVFFKVLRKISTSIVGGKLQIDSSNITEHLGIQKIMENHTRGNAYFPQFFKRPLVADCDCVAFVSHVFAPAIVPLAAYEEMHNNVIMTLPIPKTTSVARISDPHYMTFDEAVKHPFTNEPQPSPTSKP
jgi:hypothetical protein